MIIRRLLKFAALALLAILPSRRHATTDVPAPRPEGKKSEWKRWVFRGALLFGALGLLGFLVAASGIMSIKASSRHWAMTRWFLDFAKERSVATHSLGIKPPELDLEWRVLKGAGHFEVGCRPCHGGPDIPSPRIPHAMTPIPPPLGADLADWKPAELFYIVKHGIKFTGMPAWPAKDRDDEIWDVVAFLRKLPGLDARSYRRLVDGQISEANGNPLEDLLPPEGIRDIIAKNCARCHGPDGNGRGNGAFPKLAGQRPAYLFASLQAYSDSRRHSGTMGPIAASLSEDQMRVIAEYYNRLESRTVENRAAISNTAVERGKAIALNGVPQRRVPACAACHGPRPTRRNPVYPSLAGQYPEYLLLQLQLFSKKQRGGSEFHHLMHFVAGHLSDEQMQEVALFYSSLPAEHVDKER
jgi:cytochrome c553